MPRSTSTPELEAPRVVWTPQPRQEVALSCPAFELLYGGAKGGGKTDFLVASPLSQIVLADQMWRETGQSQRGRAIIFRKNLKNLADITARCAELYPVIDPGMGYRGWSKMERRWTFSSGYVVDLAHLDGPDDHLGYHGQEITALLVDQVEEIEEDVINFLAMNVRSSNPRMRELLMIRYTANPGGKHGAWVKRRFIEGCKPYNTVKSETVTLRGGRTREVTKAFVPASLFDNKYLAEDGQYEANLRRMPEHMQRMYLDGDWDVVVGAFFSHVLDPRLHFIKSFPIPASSPVKMGLDWGSSAPACCLWGTKDSDGNIFVIDELYGPGITGRTWGEKIVKKFDLQKWSGQRKYALEDVYGLMDRQARAKMGGDGRYSNAAAGIVSHGIRLFDANKDRAAGNEQTIERLLKKPDGKASLYIFADRCPNLVRTLPGLMGDPHNPQDVDSEGEDHCLSGDTIVNTTDGPFPISELVGKNGTAIGAYGEMVPFGNVRLTRRDVETMRVTAADGRSVVCTPDHLIRTTLGWKPAGKLTTDDKLHCVSMTQLSNRERSKNLQACVTTSADSTSSTRVGDSIGQSGWAHTGQCQQACTCIMSTGTGRTIGLQTSQFSQAGNTWDYTANTLAHAQARLALTTPASTLHQQTNGYQSQSAAQQAQWDGLVSAASQFNAQSAVANSGRASQVEPSFVIRGVESVSIAALEPVPGLANVYDLDVDHPDHSFVVNGGLVVHNCYDALKYLLLDWPIQSTRPGAKNEDRDVERWLRIGRERRARAHQMTEDNNSTGYGD